MQLEIREDMQKAFCIQVTKENMSAVANTIKEYSKCELEITPYENEIAIDNKTLKKIDFINEGDFVAINNSTLGYFIYTSKEEMEAVWQPLE